MKKILITGSQGFTGSRLAALLESTGLEVTGLDVAASEEKNRRAVDFADNGFAGILHALPPVDAVVHLGARIGWYGGTRADLFRPNVLATAELASWARQNNSYFIFASAALIGGETTPHITTTRGLNTENDYLYSKWLAEKNIEMSGVEHVILRISGIFGANGPGHLGVNNAITRALQGKPPVRYGDCKIKRNYVYVKDLCGAVKYCLDNRIQGTHLVGGPKPVSIAEMLETICDILLPGQEPDVRPGGGGFDQIIEPSVHLPAGRSFADAITDIKETRF
jgi:UDP-glucose 4-epimerase